MKRRAGNFGGTVQIESTIDTGTRIVLHIPLERKIFTV
jgi:signal transduction histidine kinase